MPSNSDDPIVTAFEAFKRQSATPPPGASLLVPSHESTAKPEADPIVAAFEAFKAPRADPSLTDMIVPMGLRVGGSILGGIGGGLLGGAVGVIAGGAAGSGLGEAAAEKWEGRDLNPYQIATQSALGAIPMGKAKQGLTLAQLIGRRAVQGGLMGEASTVATQLADDGTFPSLNQQVTGTVLGGVMGAGGGAAEGRIASRLHKPSPIPPQTPVPEPKRLPAAPRFQVTPTGEVVEAGTTIPMTQAPDGSYVRGVPAELGRQPKALPPGPSEPRFQVTPDGTVVEGSAAAQVPDASYVKAERGAYPGRDVKGLLPPASGYVAGEGGIVGKAGQEDDILAALEKARQAVPDASYVKGVRGEYPPVDVSAAGETVPSVQPGQTVEPTPPVQPLAAPVSASEPPPSVGLSRATTPQAPPAVQRADSSSGKPRVVALTGEEFGVGLTDIKQLRKAAQEYYDKTLRGQIGFVDRPEFGRVQFTGKGRGKVHSSSADPLKLRLLPAVPRIISEGEHVSAVDVRADKRADGIVMFHAFAAPVRVGDQEVLAGVTVGEDAFHRMFYNVNRWVKGKAQVRHQQQKVGPGPSEFSLKASLSDSIGLSEPEVNITISGVSETPVSTQHPSLPGAADNPTDEYSRFEKLFDDAKGIGVTEIATHLAGGLGGAAVGAASGDTPEDRIARATLFGVAGVMAPALLRKPSAIPPARGGVGGPRIVPGTATNVIEMPSRSAIPLNRGRSGAPIADGMKGMAPFVSKFSNPLVKDGVQRILEEHGGFTDQRRGVIDTETLGRFADEVKIHVDKVLPKGTALNAEQITGYARALRQTQERVHALAAKVTKNTATDADLVALQAAKAEAEVVVKSMIGARAEAGRALAAFNFWRGVMDAGDSELVREALNAPGLREDAQKLAKAFAALPDDPIARFKWLQAQKGSTLTNKVRSYYYANILSGVKTHERNLIGNVANIVSELAVHPAAAGLDAAKSLIQGTPRTVRLDELPAKAVGAVAGLEQGLSDFAFTLRHGMSPDALTRGLDAGASGKFDVPIAEFAGGGANPFNIPGRLLNASDNLFRSISRNIESYGMAHVQAKAEGLTGSAFAERVAQLRAGTTPEGAAIRNAAETFATRSVFQEKPGPVVSLLQEASRQFPALSFVLPFVKTPGNIARQGLEFSPAGIFMKASRQSGRQGTQAQARAALGTAAAGALAWLASSGRLSGEGPQNPADRAALMEAGWRPNSVKIGDQWISYSLFQPVSVQASIVANAYEAWKEKGADPNNVDLALSTVFRTANSFVSQSFLSGLFDLVEAIKDPDRSASRFGSRIASGMVPLSAAVRTVQQATDPVVRRPEGWQQQVKSGIPGLSQEANPRVTRFGEDVIREGGPLRRALDPFNTSTVVRDPIADEVSRLGVRVQLPTDTMTLPDGRALTPDQEHDLQQQKGRAIRSALERTMQGRRWAALSDERKRERLESLISSVRTRAAAQFRRQVLATPAETGTQKASLAEWMGRSSASR